MLGASDQSRGESLSSSPTIATPPGGQPTIYIGAGDGGTGLGPITAINEADCSVDFRVASEPPSGGGGGIWDFVSYGVSATGEGLVLYGTADPDSSVYANDAITGKLVWRYQVAQPPGDYDIGSGVAVSPPGANGIADGAAYVESKYGVLNAIDLTTGALLWSKQIPAESITTPAVSGSSIVVGTETDGVFDYSAKTGFQRWHFSDPVGMDASAAIIGPAGQKVVAIGDYAGDIDVLSLRNGALLYQHRTGGYIVASPAEAEGNLFEAAGDGFLYDFTPGGSNVAAPTTAVTVPADSSTVANPGGNLTITGTSSASAGVDAVTVAVQSKAGMWWDSANSHWTAGPYPNLATLASPGAATSGWSLPFPVPAGGGGYEVFASAVSDGVADVSAGVSAPTAARSTFSVQPSPTEPQLTVSAPFAAPGAPVVMGATGFSPGEKVTISLNGAQIGTAVADPSGAFSDRGITIPAAAGFGPGAVIATGRSSRLSTSTALYVTNSWSQFGGSAPMVGNDPNDTVFQNHIGVNPDAFLSQAWSFTAGAPVAGSVDVADGTAYFADKAGEVYALSMGTSIPIWKSQLPGAPKVTSTPAVTASGQVIITSTSGTVYALDGATGISDWTTTLGGSLGSPTVADGVIYIGSSNDSLTALEQASGSTLWSATLGGPMVSAPAVDATSGIVVVGDNSGAITALSTSGGMQVWRVMTGGPVTASPIIAGGVVYAGSTDGSVRSIGESTGLVAWTFPTGAPVAATPALINGFVVIGSDATEYWVTAANATVRWQITEPGSVTGLAGAGNFSATTETNGSITGAKPSDGNLDAWLTNQGTSLTGAPTVVNGEVIVAGQDETVKVYTLPGTPAY